MRAGSAGVGAWNPNFAALVFSYYFIKNYSRGFVVARFLFFLFPVFFIWCRPIPSGGNFSGRALCAGETKRPKIATREALRNCVDSMWLEKMCFLLAYITYYYEPGQKEREETMINIDK